jgi:hypothetical protein
MIVGCAVNLRGLVCLRGSLLDCSQIFGPNNAQVSMYFEPTSFPAESQKAIRWWVGTQDDQ